MNVTHTDGRFGNLPPEILDRKSNAPRNDDLIDVRSGAAIEYDEDFDDKRAGVDSNSLEQKTNLSPFQKQQLLLSPKETAPSQVTKEQLDTNSNSSQADSKIKIMKL